MGAVRGWEWAKDSIKLLDFLLDFLRVHLPLLSHHILSFQEVRWMGKSSSTGSIMGVIRTPLGIVILFIILLVLAGLSVASAISGELTAAAVSSAGFLVVIVLLVVIAALGKWSPDNTLWAPPGSHTAGLPHSLPGSWSHFPFIDLQLINGSIIRSEIGSTNWSFHDV